MGPTGGDQSGEVRDPQRFQSPLAARLIEAAILRRVDRHRKITAVEAAGRATERALKHVRPHRRVT
jgi:hypothetical protein